MDFAPSMLIAADLRRIAADLTHRKGSPTAARHARELAGIPAYIERQIWKPKPRKKYFLIVHKVKYRSPPGPWQQAE